MKQQRLEPVAGATVRLKRDVKTTGGQTFRAGLVMTVRHDTGELSLGVYVRKQLHYFTMTKKDWKWTLEVLSVPPKPQES